MPPPSSLSLGPGGGGHAPLHLFHVPTPQLLYSPLPIPPGETSTTSSSSNVVIVEIQPPSLPRVAKRSAQPDPGFWSGIKSIGSALNPARLWRSKPPTLPASSPNPPSFCYHCGLPTPYVEPQEPPPGTVLPVFGPELPPGFVFPGVEAEPKSHTSVAPSLKESIELQAPLNKAEETGIQVPVKKIEQPKAPVEDTGIQVSVKEDEEEVEVLKAPVEEKEEELHVDGYTRTLEKELNELKDMKRVTGSSLKPALNEALAERLEAEKKKEKQKQKKRGRAYDIAGRRKVYPSKQPQHGTGKKPPTQPGTEHGYERKHPHFQTPRNGGKPHTPGRLPMGVFETFEEHSSWEGPGRPGWRKTDAEDYRRYLDANPYVREAIRAGYAKPLNPAISVIYPDQLARDN
ncbi:hypothetical protein K440DRAFT_639991 [Wilcoxina mikolae CBS 423.85]|nr:hypothetical protein K440DRAFT_639991 [Wilcoxina mikolae CBS 423.85]